LKLSKLGHLKAGLLKNHPYFIDASRAKVGSFVLQSSHGMQLSEKLELGQMKKLDGCAAEANR